ncbi:MAG: hypothetical protein ABL963_02825 [Longimicrobiales bacterium]
MIAPRRDVALSCAPRARRSRSSCRFTLAAALAWSTALAAPVAGQGILGPSLVIDNWRPPYTNATTDLGSALGLGVVMFGLSEGGFGLHAASALYFHSMGDVDPGDYFELSLAAVYSPLGAYATLYPSAGVGFGCVFQGAVRCSQALVGQLTYRNRFSLQAQYWWSEAAPRTTIAFVMGFLSDDY